MTARKLTTKLPRRPAFMRLRVSVARPSGHYVNAGSVMLHFGAPAIEVEHALVAIGVYAPRGGDVLTWCDPDVADILSVVAYVDSADGETLVRLLRVQP